MTNRTGFTNLIFRGCRILWPYVESQTEKRNDGIEKCTCISIFTLHCDKNQSTKDNSDSGGCETFETPNIFMFPSVLSFITILIWSCFYFRKI